MHKCVHLPDAHARLRIGRLFLVLGGPVSFEVLCWVCPEFARTVHAADPVFSAVNQDLGALGIHLAAHDGAEGVGGRFACGGCCQSQGKDEGEHDELQAEEEGGEAWLSVCLIGILGL